MTKRLYILVVLCLFGVIGQTYAQPSEQQMAAYYFNNGEFEKAALYYTKLYERQPTDTNYKFYLQSLLALKRHKDAEKLVKKQKRRYPTKVSYTIDLAEVYEISGEYERAEEIYDKAIKDVSNDYRSILDLGDAFKTKGKLDMAIQVYEKGKKHVNSYPFGLKTAELYGKTGHTEQMINDYLDVVGKFNHYMVTVQNGFVRLLDFKDPKNPSTDLLRTTLLKRIQKSPDDLVYTEMLIWYFIQIEDFNSSMIQAKAFDRRQKNSEGEDVLVLSRMCKVNRVYDVAVKGYKYIIENYPKGYYFSTAKTELMETLFEKVTSSSYTRQELLDLESKFEEILSPTEMGKNSVTVPLMLKLAHIEGFYLHNLDKAQSILEEAVAIPRISKALLGECKLEMGDVQMLAGNVWDASLYYMQVDKMFKEDILGHEAKFRNAKIYYYTGQFDWAQSQLDILKASTSKLISNDAMELSLLITDNMGLDTTPRPMMLFAQADLLIYQNQFQAAIGKMDSITQEYGQHALNDEILYRKYEIAHKQRDFEKAVNYLSAIVTGHGDDILADDALYHLAQIYDYQIRDKEKAQEYYKQLIFDYKGSIYAEDSRNRFEQLGGGDTPGIIKTINKDKTGDEEGDGVEIQYIDGLTPEEWRQWPEDPSDSWLFDNNWDKSEYKKAREEFIRKKREERGLDGKDAP